MKMKCVMGIFYCYWVKSKRKLCMQANVMTIPQNLNLQSIQITIQTTKEKKTCFGKQLNSPAAEGTGYYIIT